MSSRISAERLGRGLTQARAQEHTGVSVSDLDAVFGQYVTELVANDRTASILLDLLAKAKASSAPQVLPADGLPIALVIFFARPPERRAVSRVPDRGRPAFRERNEEEPEHSSAEEPEVPASWGESPGYSSGPGDPEYGDTGPDDTEYGDTGPDDTEYGDTGPGNTGYGDTGAISGPSEPKQPKTPPTSPPGKSSESWDIDCGATGGVHWGHDAKTGKWRIEFETPGIKCKTRGDTGERSKPPKK